MNDNTVKLTILHSNDVHGDFLPEERDGIMTGGLPLLSGYINKVRKEEDHVIYAVAGDMFMGSVIEKEYKGLSTIGLVNVLEPDVFAIGNHEVDYGLAHLLFLEKCADFPVVCGNMYVKALNRRLFLPYTDVLRGGLRVRFIGMLTETIADQIRQEDVIDSAVSVRSVAKEVKRICSAAANEDVDLTVLLTHIGIEADRKLARELDPAWGVDLIIGGHSHTVMSEMEVINGVPIVHAGSGSNHIGRLDLEIDQRENRIVSCKWRCDEINSRTAVPDPLMEFYIDNLHRKTDERFNEILTVFPRAYNNTGIHCETELLDLFTDIFQDMFGTDLFLLSSNTLKTDSLGPALTRNDLLRSFPYENEVYRITVTGEQLEGIVRYICRKEAFTEHIPFFFYSGSMKVWLDAGSYDVLKILWQDEPVQKDKLYTAGMTRYAFRNLREFFGITEKEITVNGRITRLCINDRDVLEEYFSMHDHLQLKNEKRLIIIGEENYGAVQ